MARRKYTREFKVSAVKLVNEQGYTIPDAARSPKQKVPGIVLIAQAV